MDNINVLEDDIFVNEILYIVHKNVYEQLNDTITRKNVVNILRDFFNKKCIYDISIICNEENNTPELINMNIFIVDLLYKDKKYNIKQQGHIINFII